MALLDGLSQLDKARNDTLTQRAGPQWFDILCRMYGLPRITGTSVKNWRAAVKAANFAKRDAPATIFTLCREALREQDAVQPAKIRAGGIYEHRLYSASGPGFTQSDVFRVWQVEGVYYFAHGIGPFTGEYAAYLELAPWQGATWAACSWSNLPWPPPTSGWRSSPAYRLPFLLRGHSGKAELVLEQAGATPPTFLQDTFLELVESVPFDGTVVTRTIAAAPADGILTQFSFNEGATMALVVEDVGPFKTTVTVSNVDPATIPAGPWNFYVGAGEDNLFQYASIEVLGDGLFKLHDVTLVSGTSDPLVVGAQANIDLDPARGGTYHCQFFVGLLPVADLTLAASQRTVILDGDVAEIAKGDPISVQIYAAPGTTRPLQHVNISVAMKRPDGQPLGGNFVSANEADDPSTGPWPIYLSGGESVEWRNLLDNMVALGVEPVARVSTHLNSD